MARPLAQLGARVTPAARAYRPAQREDAECLPWCVLPSKADGVRVLSHASLQAFENGEASLKSGRGDERIGV